MLERFLSETSKLLSSPNKLTLIEQSLHCLDVLNSTNGVSSSPRSSRKKLTLSWKKFKTVSKISNILVNHQSRLKLTMIPLRLGRMQSETLLPQILTLDVQSSSSKERKELHLSIMIWSKSWLMKFPFLLKWFLQRQFQELKESDLLLTRSSSNVTLKLEEVLGDLKTFPCVMSQQWFVVLKYTANWKIEANPYLDGVLLLTDLEASSTQSPSSKEKMTMMLENQLV